MEQRKTKRVLSPELTETKRVKLPPMKQVTMSQNDNYHQRMANIVSSYHIDYNEFRSYLINNQSIVAGSSIVQVLRGELYEGSDIDVYVPVRNFPVWTDAMNKLGYEKRKSYYSNQYRQSFLFQNGIKEVVSYSHPDDDKLEVNESGDTTPLPAPTIQIMSVRNRTNPLNVVGTFDLSFCKCWFDGNMFYADSIEDVMNKVGYLSNEYAARLLEGSWVMAKRVIKYLKRGFDIRLRPEFPTQVPIKELMELGQMAYDKNYNEREYNWVGERMDKSALDEYYKNFYNRYLIKMFETPEKMRKWLVKFAIKFNAGVEPSLSLRKLYHIEPGHPIFMRESFHRKWLENPHRHAVPQDKDAIQYITTFSPTDRTVLDGYDSDEANDDEVLLEFWSEKNMETISFLCKLSRFIALRVALKIVFNYDTNEIYDRYWSTNITAKFDFEHVLYQQYEGSNVEKQILPHPVPVTMTIYDKMAMEDFEMVNSYPTLELKEEEQRVGKISRNMPYIVYGGFVQDESYTDTRIGPEQKILPESDFALIKSIKLTLEDNI